MNRVRLELNRDSIKTNCDSTKSNRDPVKSYRPEKILNVSVKKRQELIFSQLSIDAFLLGSLKPVVTDWKNNGKGTIMPEPTPPAPQPKKKQTRSPLNQAQIATLTKAEQLCLAAKKPVYTAALAAREIDAAVIEALEADIATCRNKSADALQSTNSKATATGGEAQSEEALLIALQEVQCAAKQKFSRSAPTKLKDYGIGVRLDANRPSLEQWSQNILNKLGSESLPGITPAKVTNLGALRAAYIDANAAQGSEQSRASGGRGEVEGLIEAITNQRITLQYAADAEWPHSNPANAGTRKEFYLPVNKPFNG